jgi:hypothetical protein
MDDMDKLDYLEHIWDDVHEMKVRMWLGLADNIALYLYQKPYALCDDKQQEDVSTKLNQTLEEV